MSYRFIVVTDIFTVLSEIDYRNWRSILLIRNFDTKMDQLRSDHEEMQKEAHRLKTEIEAELEQVLPVLEEGENALRSITMQDISVIRSLAKPPQAFKLTTDAVLTLLNRETGWENGKKLLRDANFIKQLLEFERENADNEKLRPFVEDEDFDLAKQKRASSLGHSLAMWVKSIYTFNEVYGKVAPQRDQYGSLLNRIKITEEAINNLGEDNE